MGKLTRKCKATGEVPSVMELSHPHVVVVLGVKTRARSQPKRRKSCSSSAAVTSNNSAPQTGNCSTPASSCCSSSESESLRSVIDLEDTHAEFENSPPYSDSSMRNLHSESNTAAEVNSDLKSTMPTAEEIDDFFAQLEKDQDDTKKLTQKYNFDFANETPLEGRYEWIPLKP